MKTKTIEIYTFNELSDKAKETAVEQNYDYNVYFDWWDNTYYDAENVGIKIKEFDIDRGRCCKIEFKYDAREVCEKIQMEHGEGCETYRIASTFLSDYEELVKKYSDGIKTNIVAEDNEYDFDNDADELEDELRNDLAEEYLSILRKEYEYLTSEEAIAEALEANEIAFLVDGNKY